MNYLLKQMVIFRSVILLCVTLFVYTWGYAQDVNEADFFEDGLSAVDTTLNLVSDFGVNASDTLDDSENLQQAIDFATQFPNGGRIDIPAGTYFFSGIKMKNNVHLVIDSMATLVATAPTGVMFSFGLNRKGNDALVTIRSVSIRSNGRKYTVDLRKGAVNAKLWFANCRNVNNFMIEGFRILDHYTKMSGVTLNLAQEGDQAFMATNGVVKNGDIENAHVGYGLIQVQCAKHVLFRDLAGQGGVTLRMESGAVADSPDYIKIDSIWARNISTRYGSSAFIMGAHTKVNGYVNIDTVYGFSSGSVGSVGRGFVTQEEAAAGKTPGYFSPDCVIKNVHGVFGPQAQVKWKNLDMIPCELRYLIPEEKNGPDGESYICPSFGVFGWNDTAITNITNITGEGYVYGKIIYTKEDEIADCSTVNVKNTLQGNVEIFPNPATDFVNVMATKEVTLFIYDANGCSFFEGKVRGQVQIDVSPYPRGVYFFKIKNNNEVENRKIIIQ